MSRPLRARELKPEHLHPALLGWASRPLRARELKPAHGRKLPCEQESRPLRARELKQLKAALQERIYVAPLAGA